MRLHWVRVRIRRMTIAAAVAAIVFPMQISRLLAFADDRKGVEDRSLPARNEIVMSPGMRITATTTEGTIAVTAVDELTRSYTWEGATRSVEMIPRPKRWYGSLGLYYPGPGQHWSVHHGIRRGVVEEGQQHFKSIEEAMKWIKDRAWIPMVYRDDGLLVGYGKTLPREQLNVEVWQVFIEGKKPERLPGSRNDKVTVATVQTETSPLVQAVKKNDFKAVADLLGQGANPNSKDSVGTPVLILAAAQGSANTVEEFLKKGADPNGRDEEGATALLKSVVKRHETVVKALLQGGADVNAAYSTKDMMQGVTPLMSAAMTGSVPLLEILLKKGANVDAVSGFGQTALDVAKMMKKEGIVQRLQKTGAKR